MAIIALILSKPIAIGAASTNVGEWLGARKELCQESGSRTLTFAIADPAGPLSRPECRRNAQPEGRSRALFRYIAAKQKQFRQHRLQFRHDVFPHPLGIGPGDRAIRDLVAGGI